MNIIDALRKRILKFLRIEQLDNNPNSERLTFISDEDNIKMQNVEEARIWYYGDSNELTNYYTNEALYGSYKEPMYNKNRRQYFWAQSVTETHIKRVHSGIPNAIVTTLTNAIGLPKIESREDLINHNIDEIVLQNDLFNILNQQQIPLTLVEGWGAFKLNISQELSKYPIIQYYEAKNVEFVYKCGILIGIIYKDYYKYNNRNYLLLETRRIANGSSYIEYELFELKNNDEVEQVTLDEIPELSDLKNLIIPDYNKILGTPSKFFFDMLNKNYGKSIFSGKIDLFDDLDQILSQDSQTVRVSTPVEYYPVDLLERTKDGNPKLPQLYNRQYVKLDTIPNGDGEVNGTIQTTQPQLNFEQYSADAKSKLDFILTGLLSPASMGIDVAKKDNADAQREKEKVTIMMRNNVINRCIIIYKDLIEKCLDLMEYMQTGNISENVDYKISVTFNEFANPSFEEMLRTLGDAWSNGEISTERYVDLLWGDKLSDEEKAAEVMWLDNNKQSMSTNLDELVGEQYANATTGDVEEVGAGEEETARTEDTSNSSNL